MDYSKELKLARMVAQEAGAVQLAAQPTDNPVERKSDRSPVTAVDKQCEDLIREKLLSAFPCDGFLGEEGGSHDGSTGRCWIVDPLDGTRPFIRGIPTYSSLVALEEEGGEPVVGVIHLPALGETYWAAKGAGAFCNDTPICVSATKILADATGCALGYIQNRREPASSTSA